MTRDPNRSSLRILCISPLFVPLTNAEAFCGGKLVKALLGEGADVTVLWSSSWKKAGPQGLDESALWEPLRAVSVDLPALSGRSPAVALLSALRYRVRFFPRWIKCAVTKALEMHSRVPFDVVYSRSNPMVAHVVGYWCARQLSLPWVVNINDPWDSHRLPTLLARLRPSRTEQFISEYWLRKTLQSAALITFPSRHLISHHGVHAETRGNVEVIPHVGCAAADVAAIQNYKSPEFNLVHTGALSSEEFGRSTRALLLALAEFLGRTPAARPLTRLTFVGTRDPETNDLAVQLGLMDVIRFVGRLSYEKSLKEISAASVCVLVEAAIEKGIFLPSKLVDYIVARKPVLALSPRTGVVADMAAAGELLRVDPDDGPAIRRAIADLYSDFRRDGLRRWVPGEDFARQFEPQVVAGRFLDAVGRVLDYSV